MSLVLSLLPVPLLHGFSTHGLIIQASDRSPEKMDAQPWRQITRHKRLLMIRYMLDGAGEVVHLRFCVSVLAVESAPRC